MTQEFMSSLYKSGLVRYIDNNNINIIKNGEKKQMTINDFILSPSEHVEYVDVNIYILVVSLIDDRKYDSAECVLSKCSIGQPYYDALINHLLTTNDVNLSLLKYLYDKVTVELREFTISNCLSCSRNNDALVSWIKERLDDEVYFDYQKIFSTVVSLDLLMWEKIKNSDLFDVIKNEILVPMTLDCDHLNMYLQHYKEKYNTDKLDGLSEDSILSTLITAISMNNVDVCELLVKNITLNQNSAYTWLSLLLITNKFDMLNLIFEHSNIQKINNENVKILLNMISGKLTNNIFVYLMDNSDKFEGLDLTDNNHAVLRNAILNENVELVKALFEKKIYTQKSTIEEDELLNDTVEFFASDEINELIEKYLS